MHTYKSLNRLCLCRRHHHIGSLLRFVAARSFFPCLCILHNFYFASLFFARCVIKMRFSVQIVQCSSKRFSEEKRQTERQSSAICIVMEHNNNENPKPKKIYIKWQKKMTQIPLTEKILSLNFFAKQLLYHYTIALACIYNLVSGLFPALRMFHFFPILLRINQ